VLVHGAPADHTRWRPLLPYLESHATVHAMDRRGRGASGDAPDYHLAREFEDVAAVVDAVAEASGSAVDVYGHSFGGLCAFGGATLNSSIRRLVLYEGWPPVNPDAWALPPGIGPRVDALLADGDGEAVAEMVFS
jgi:pimeloyl-ACP methyl ester carboxylesterase